jgi:hypothetical protein
MKDNGFIEIWQRGRAISGNLFQFANALVHRKLFRFAEELLAQPRNDPVYPSSLKIMNGGFCFLLRARCFLLSP